MKGKKERKIGFTLRVGGGRSPIMDRRNWDGYIVNKKIVRIKPKQGLEMMGFPKSFKMPVSEKLTLSLPLHYKIEKDQATIEPRLMYKLEKVSLWVQKEFNHEENMNAAFGLDIPVKDFTYRVGWDSSNTVRVRLAKKF